MPPSFWTRLLWVRAVQLALIGLALVLLPLPHRGVLLALDLTVGCTSTLLWRRSVRRSNHLPPLYIYFDVVVLSSVMVAIGPAFGPMLLLLGAVPPYAAVAFGRRHGLLLTAATVVAAGVSVIVNRPPFGSGLVVVFLVGLLSTVVVVTEADRRVHRIRTDVEAVVSDLGVAIWEAAEPGSQVRSISPSIETMLGWPWHQFFVTGFWESIVHPDDAWVVSLSLANITAGTSWSMVYRMRTQDGEHRWFEERVSCEIDDGRVVASRGVLLDVTDRRTAEVRMQQLAEIVDALPMPVLVGRLDDVDDATSLRVTVVNPAAELLIQQSATAVIGHHAIDVFPRLQLRGAELLAGVIRSGRPAELPGSFPYLDGDVARVFSGFAFPVPDACVALALTDVTDREQMSNALRQQANHDALTGLPNRRLLLERLAKVVTRNREAGRATSLVLADLDQFKEVNDALGHDVGDQLLRALGVRISSSGLPIDLLARLGGDEFAAIVSHDVGSHEALSVGRRLAESIAVPVEIHGVVVQTHASVGVATIPDHADDTETLVKRADIAMYQAKHSGSGVALYASEHDRSSVMRVTLLGELRGAIARDELRVVFQPIVNLHTGIIESAEALVRWQHPVNGLLLPAAFLEMAEVSGLIDLVTNWVLAEATRAAATWRAAGHDVSVAVNLSVRSLYTSNLAERIGEILLRADLPARLLRLELTEHTVMHDAGLAAAVLGELRAAGLSVSVDDFGTAYSSLWLLRDLPIDELKIDRTFVQALADGDSRLIRAIVDLAHSLDLRVVAEGVEDLETVSRLTALGCDLAQGYFLGRPMPMADLMTRMDGLVVGSRSR